MNRSLNQLACRPSVRTLVIGRTDEAAFDVWSHGATDNRIHIKSYWAPACGGDAGRDADGAWQV